MDKKNPREQTGSGRQKKVGVPAFYVTLFFDAPECTSFRSMKKNIAQESYSLSGVHSKIIFWIFLKVFERSGGAN